MLSKKYYKRIAEIIRTSKRLNAEYTECIDVIELIDELCIFFKENNPRFDKDRFVAACCGESI